MDQASQYREPTEEQDLLAEHIVKAAFQVHKKLGPGLLERFYRDSLIIELKKRGLNVDKEVPIPVFYDGIRLEGFYTIDLFVENEIVVELKTVEELSPIHHAQLRTYLKIAGRRLGLLVNFNSTVIDLKRVLNKDLNYP